MQKRDIPQNFVANKTYGDQTFAGSLILTVVSHFPVSIFLFI
jgi:hypothetical protein